MKIKWIVLDLDGTLLNSQKELPDKFWEMKEELEAAGIKFILASGRQHARMRSVMTPFSDDFLYLSDNGTLVFENQERLLAKTIEKDLAQRIIGIIWHHFEDLDIVVNTTEKSFFHRDITQDMLETFKEYYEKYDFVEDLTTLKEVVKISIYDKNDVFENIEVLDQFQNQVNITHSGPTWVDIVPKDANKGLALEFVAKKYGIEMEEIMVFGDAMNDYDMLKIAGYPVVMENADPRLKQQGYRVTASNDENGVMKVLEELLNDRT